MSMLRFVDEHHAGRGGLTRREWLRIGTLAGGGLCAGTLGALARATSGGPGWGRAKSVIVLFASGGQSQLDMWDPKPDAPLDVRGAFAPLATVVPGIRFTEHMPRVARVADRLTVVRSMSHDDVDHGSAVYLALTGRYHPRRSSNPSPSRDDFPTLGALVRRLRGGSQHVFDAVHLNGPALVPTTVSPGQDGGILGRAWEPLVVGDVRTAGVIPGLAPYADVPTVRLNQRLALKEALESATRDLEQHRRAVDMDELYRRAFDMLASPATRDAFDLDAEPAKVRERYGRHRSGQACLLARRLVEAGVPYINVIWNHSNRGQDQHPDDTDLYGWDTHNDIFVALREHLLPRFDESFSALIEDLDQRGLLEHTLVICMGEFGRAPRVALEPRFAGATPGRKHWASVYSIAFAGAGVTRGAVLGASDRLGGEPATTRYGPWDVAATILHALGHAPDDEYHDAFGRPFALTLGRPMLELY